VQTSDSTIHCRTTGFESLYGGSLTGSSVSSFEDTIDCKAGRDHGHGTETFNGTIDGVGSGSLTWDIRFESAFDCATFGVSAFTGRTVVTSGTGDFANRARRHVIAGTYGASSGEGRRE
jgi:hypothetical protein